MQSSPDFIRQQDIPQLDFRSHPRSISIGQALVHPVIPERPFFGGAAGRRSAARTSPS
jgi:hypothetical protein